MNRNYCVENFQRVLQKLTTHPGDMKRRLKVVQGDLEMVDMSMPEVYRDEWNEIWSSFNKYPARRTDSGKEVLDQYSTNVSRCRNATLAEIVQRMYLFYHEKFA